MKIVYIDMDDTISNFSDAYNNARTAEPSIEHPHLEYGFFANLEPIDDAIHALNILIISNIYDPYILTAPSSRNPFSYIEKRTWLKRYFGSSFKNKLIMSPNKGLLKGDILIDDMIKGKGQELFEGRLIHFGSIEYPTWESILTKLKLA